MIQYIDPHGGLVIRIKNSKVPDGSGSLVALAELENGSVAFGEGRLLGRAEGEVKGRFWVQGLGFRVWGVWF